MLRKIVLLTTFFFFVLNTDVLACDVCKKQQPRMLRGVTHGAGPQSDWDYVVVWAIGIIVVISLVYAVRWIVSPGEQRADHIKRTVFHFD